jgi:hypothetical protein
MSTQHFTPSADIDDKACVEAARLIERGRKVRFVVKISYGRIVEMKAQDADPWAAGWTLYHEHRQRMMMKWMILAGGAILPMLYIFGLGKKK